MPRTKQIAIIEQQCIVRAAISKYMDLRGVSEEELATAIQISVRTLQNKRKAPETFLLGELQRAATKLRCPIEELCGGKDYSKEFQSVADTLVSIVKKIS